MEKILSLNEEINEIIKKKLCNCSCNPCHCSDQTKDIYFQELKDTLTRFNEEFLIHNAIRNVFLINESRSL